MKRNRTNDINFQEEEEENKEQQIQQQEDEEEEEQRIVKMQLMKQAFDECFYECNRDKRYIRLVHPYTGKHVIERHIAKVLGQSNYYVAESEFIEMMKELGHTPSVKTNQYNFICKENYYNEYILDTSQYKRKRRSHI